MVLFVHERLGGQIAVEVAKRNFEGLAAKLQEMRKVPALSLLLPATEAEKETETPTSLGDMSGAPPCNLSGALAS